MASIQSKPTEVKSAGPNENEKRLFLELGEDSQCQNPSEPRAPCSWRVTDILDSGRLNLTQLFVCNTNILPSEKLKAIYTSLFSGPI